MKLKIFSTFAFLLAIPNAASAKPMCEEVANQAAAVFAYCSQNTSAEQLAEFISVTKVKYMHPTMNQVHIYIFDNKKKTPTSMKAFTRMSERDVKKHQFAVFSENKNTDFKSFYCRKAPGKALQDCAKN